MKVHLVSAIFQSPPEFRARNLQETMETLLADGLLEAGIDVTVGGHSLRDRWDADIIHIHHLANACLRLALPRRTPVVFTRHATKNIPFHHQLVLAQTYRASKAVVALSDSEAQSVSAKLPGKNVVRIYNGTDPRHFLAAPRIRPNGPWRFVYVGQLVELKRVEQAIQLVHELVSGGHDIVLDIVSHRPTLQTQLRDLAIRLGVGARISFLGAKTRQELGEVLRESHALVLPSRTEALPTVITEALFSGLPVLAFKVGGIAEQVPAGIELPQVDDFRGYLDRARELISDYERFSAIYDAHVDTAVKKFSISRMVEEHIALYRSVSEKS